MLREYRNGFEVMPCEPLSFFTSDYDALMYDWLLTVSDLNLAWNSISWPQAATNTTNLQRQPAE